MKTFKKEHLTLALKRTWPRIMMFLINAPVLPVVLSAVLIAFCLYVDWPITVLGVLCLVLSVTIEEYEIIFNANRNEQDNTN